MLVGTLSRNMADFEHPLELLKACHARIEMQCATLDRLAAHLPVHGCDAQAQQAASNVMRYFDSAGRHHHEDEEQSLFPRLIAAAGGHNAERIAPLVEQLKREHQDMEVVWLDLRVILEKIAHGGNAALNEQIVNRFRSMHHGHIALEEANLIPLATILLLAEELTALGQEMAARRGVR